jgi:hypothetical protein
LHIVSCPAGLFLVNDTTPYCEGCPKDTYKDISTEDDYYLQECKTCPEDYTTRQENATSVDDCFFGENHKDMTTWNNTCSFLGNCIAGQIIDPNNSSQCLNCSFGSYQSNPQPGLEANCTECQEGFSTAREGATDEAECEGNCWNELILPINRDALISLYSSASNWWTVWVSLNHIFKTVFKGTPRKGLLTDMYLRSILITLPIKQNYGN